MNSWSPDPAVVLLAAVVLFGCGGRTDGNDTLFVTRLPEHTGVRFANHLTASEELNTYVFRNFYNGGGVAIGDINNDELPDLFLSGNQVSNRLYLNRGGLHFEDITDEAGLVSEGVWSTGVTMVDVNGDGLLDIYVCKSGPPGGTRRHNELFVNNGDLTFTERAEEYGIAVTGLSIHASFFDYDGDGDLDMYLLSNPIRSLDQLRRQPGLRSIRDPDGGNKLFRNELIANGPGRGGTPRFTEVTEEAGIYSSQVGFGLGVSVADIDRDGWPDIYVSNDFFERDYLYVNRQNGSFDEVLPRLLGEISLSSMGGDIADVSGDGYPEIFVSDMLPGHEARRQSKISFTSWDEYADMEADGYHNQSSRNTLHWARLAPAASDRDVPTVYFSEVGRLAGVDATDWSWGGLFADFDLDGRRDLFVPNGIYKDLLDQDFITRISNPETFRRFMRQGDEPIMRLLDEVPSTPLPNYFFAGSGGVTFEDVSETWSASEPSFSNGSAYGDLDGDGDLDLVVNNVNMEAFIYENQAADRHPDRSWLLVDLEGLPPNPYAVGAQLTAWWDSRQWYVEQQPARGFQSSVDPVLHLAFGTATPSHRLDSLVVRWPGGAVSTLADVPLNQRLRVRAPELVDAAVTVDPRDAVDPRDQSIVLKRTTVFKGSILPVERRLPQEGPKPNARPPLPNPFEPF